MVAEGYKRTEVGVIPEDWKIVFLKDVVVQNGLVRGPFGGALKKEYFVKNGYKVYEQRNAIYADINIGNYFVDQNKFDELKRFEIQENDFIVSCSGTIGRIHRIPKNSPKGIINQALLKITIDTNKIESDYFLTIFRWDKFQAKIIDSTQGGAMKNLVGMDIFKNTPIQIPIIKEQKAIATALSDVDELIASLESLITKKENIKTAAMQQLLTGKKRLDGFSGEWVEKKLGDIVEFKKGKGLPKSALAESGLYRCIHYGELFTVYKESISTVKSSTNDNQECVYSKVNDVLMPTSDVTPNGLATASCINENGIILGGDILIIRAYPNILNGVFLSYYISVNKEKVMKLVSGSTVYHLYGSDMANLELNIPPVEEQTAIANILFDMDSDIKALKTKLVKTKAIKTGMMQELLTGKTRLSFTRESND